MKAMQALTRHELLAVLRAARENNRRDFCLILIAYSHGCRATEAAKLKLANLNIRDWTLRIERPKHSKTTVQTILPNAERLLDERKAINEWLAHRPNLGPYLFSKPNGGALSRVQVYRLFRSYAEAAGLPEAKRGPHALKHALAQHMVNERQDVARVQAALGHASISSTICYFGISAQQAAEARAAALMA